MILARLTIARAQGWVITDPRTSDKMLKIIKGSVKNRQEHGQTAAAVRKFLEYWEAYLKVHHGKYGTRPGAKIDYRPAVRGRPAAECIGRRARARRRRLRLAIADSQSISRAHRRVGTAPGNRAAAQARSREARQEVAEDAAADRRRGQQASRSRGPGGAQGSRPSR